ncbi:hypothetical protein TNCV_4143771 [Trichonephila clavipes]|nr:hypothetical protein TNCV_4143771 [Trichonephila clavipes]
MSPSVQEENERGPMPTSVIKDLLKKWEAVRAMVLEWHPKQADVSRPRPRHGKRSSDNSTVQSLLKLTYSSKFCFFCGEHVRE